MVYHKLYCHAIGRLYRAVNYYPNRKYPYSFTIYIYCVSHTAQVDLAKCEEIPFAFFFSTSYNLSYFSNLYREHQ